MWRTQMSKAGSLRSPSLAIAQMTLLLLRGSKPAASDAVVSSNRRN